MRLKIVHVISHSFLPAEDGGRLKSASIATVLAQRGDLHWVCLDDQNRSQGPAVESGMVTLPWGGQGTFHSLLHASAKRRLPRSPMGWFKAVRAGVRLPLSWLPYTQRHGEAMALIRRLKPDLVIADETMMAPFAAFSDAKWRVIHTHNHDSVLMGQEVFWGESRDRQLRLARRLARFEQRLFPLVEQVWGVKTEDLAAFGKLGIGQDRLFKIPNVVPDACFEPRPGVRRASQGVFFGSMWYPPNLEALRRLLDSWPGVRQRLPDAQLSIAGRGVPEALVAKAAAIGGIEILGFVPNLKALLNHAAVAIIPLEFGAGTKIKTIEALASGVPVLATPVAAEGLGLIDGEHALIRESGPAFSNALVDMLSNPEGWQPMGLRGQAFAKEHFSMAALAGAVNQALDALGVRE